MKAEKEEKKKRKRGRNYANVDLQVAGAVKRLFEENPAELQKILYRCKRGVPLPFCP
jgi:hypothetical protein